MLPDSKDRESITLLDEYYNTSILSSTLALYPGLMYNQAIQTADRQL
jgi:hypothetical protein